MSTDRELLKLAAKAGGFGAPDTGEVCWTESEYPRGSGKNGALWNYVGHCGTAELWNPLTDDGDALRLAVKLHLCLLWPELRGRAYQVGASQVGARKVPPFEKVGTGIDESAATRRAIVRAAAAIGEQIP